MTTTSSPNGQFPALVRSAARMFLTRNLVPVPVHYRAKNPVPEGWQRLTIETFDLDRLFPPGEYRIVGVLNGEPSGNLADADLEHREVRAAAAVLLPDTGKIWGRASAPDSHYGYVTDDPLGTASEQYLDGRASPESVRWVTNQNTRWGSCTPGEGSIRLSHRLQGMPEYVVDYVLLHELAHLLVPGHGPRFWQLLDAYPRTERARGYLEGVVAAGRLPYLPAARHGENGPDRAAEN